MGPNCWVFHAIPHRGSFRTKIGSIALIKLLIVWILYIKYSLKNSNKVNVLSYTACLVLGHPKGLHWERDQGTVLGPWVLLLKS